MYSNNIAEAIEEIDAGFFSGDTFRDKEAVCGFEWYLARWQREIDSIRESLEEEEEST